MTEHAVKQIYEECFTHCILVDSSTLKCWTSPFVILGVWVYFVAFILFLMENPVSKRSRPDQMPHDVASDLGLRCLPMTFLMGFQTKLGSFRLVS